MIKKICKHCKGNVYIRNPSGFCDHLHYPSNCKICEVNCEIEELKHKRLISVIEENIKRG